MSSLVPRHTLILSLDISSLRSPCLCVLCVKPFLRLFLLFHPAGAQIRIRKSLKLFPVGTVSTATSRYKEKLYASLRPKKSSGSIPARFARSSVLPSATAPAAPAMPVLASFLLDYKSSR